MLSKEVKSSRYNTSSSTKSVKSMKSVKIPGKPLRSRISVLTTETPNMFRLKKSTTPQISESQSQSLSSSKIEHIEPSIVKQSIAKICANLMDNSVSTKSKKEETFKAPDEISSIINKEISKSLSIKLAELSQGIYKNKGEQIDKNTIVNNMYIIIGIFISLLKLFDFHDKILHAILLGDIGNKVDAMYKIGLSIAALTLTKKNQSVMDMILPDNNVVYSFHRDPMSIDYYEMRYYGGGLKSLRDLSIDELKKLHTKMYVNIKKILDFLNS